MNALLICPAERPNVPALGKFMPLVNLRICGKPLLFYWLEFLSMRGATNVQVLAADRPHLVRQLVGDGSRWGLHVEVIPERRELSITEAVERYNVTSDSFLPFPDAVAVTDHLPINPSLPLFESYSAFFELLNRFVPKAAADPGRIGVREIQPSVWTGLHTEIPPTTRLTPPCWIGDGVQIGENVELGPGVIIEHQCILDDHTTIAESLVAPETYVGPGTEIRKSIAIGNQLINWECNSVAELDDPFLVSSLASPVARHSESHLLGRIAACLCLAATSPLAFIWVIFSNLRAQPVLRECIAVDPTAPNRRTFTYYEFANCTGLWQRWPQLWNVARGEFAWVGNRPLSPIEAESLRSEYEKLWLDAPVGLLSQADAEGCFETLSDESKVHSSYYAVNRSFRNDIEIIWKVITACGKRTVTDPLPLNTEILKPQEISLGKQDLR